MCMRFFFVTLWLAQALEISWVRLCIRQSPATKDGHWLIDYRTMASACNEYSISPRVYPIEIYTISSSMCRVADRATLQRLNLIFCIVTTIQSIMYICIVPYRFCPTKKRRRSTDCLTGLGGRCLLSGCREGNFGRQKM
jgi:hypothetical protein